MEDDSPGKGRDQVRLCEGLRVFDYIMESETHTEQDTMFGVVNNMSHRAGVETFVEMLVKCGQQTS